MSAVNKHRRLFGENFDLRVPIGQRHHDLTLTIARDLDGVPREISFVGRGKTGAGLDQFLLELGIQCSRAMQRRDPETGEAL